MNTSTIAQNQQRQQPVHGELVEPQRQYPNCFGCGADNPIGLHLRYRHEGDALLTEFTPGEAHQGWPGIVHGGIITTLLYEVMENFAYHNGAMPMMRNMQTRFRRPAKTGERITATARLINRNGREMSVTASLTQAQGELIAEGSAELVSLNKYQRRKIGV